MEDESDEDSTDDELNVLREQFKRKAETSPENVNEFETILSKKEKKKLKKSLNKSK